MEKMKNFFKGWTTFDYIWLIVANLVILGCSLYWHDSLIAIISAMTGVTCVIFVNKQMVANYPIGIINILLYSYLSYQSRLYGDFTLNLFYYIPTNIYGWYAWKKSAEKTNGIIEARMLSKASRTNLAIISMIIIFIYGYFLKLIGGNVPLVDSASTILSIIAMILMIKQYTEQWHIWVLVNIASIIMWAISLSQGSGDVATLLMWIVYLINSILGLINWKKSATK